MSNWVHLWHPNMTAFFDRHIKKCTNKSIDKDRHNPNMTVIASKTFSLYKFKTESSTTGKQMSKYKLRDHHQTSKTSGHVVIKIHEMDNIFIPVAQIQVHQLTALVQQARIRQSKDSHYYHYTAGNYRKAEMRKKEKKNWCEPLRMTRA